MRVFVASVPVKEKGAPDDEIPFKIGKASLIHYLENLSPEEWERGQVEVPAGSGPVSLLAIRESVPNS